MWSSDCRTQAVMSLPSEALDEHFSNATLIQQLKTAGLLAHHETPSKLCHHCASIRRIVGCDHTSNAWTLLQSSGECDLCALVVESMAAEARKGLGPPSEAHDPEIRRKEDAEIYLNYYRITKEEPRRVRTSFKWNVLVFEAEEDAKWGMWHTLASFQPFTDASQHCQKAEIPLRILLTEKPELPALSFLVKRWMARCQQRHQECHSPDQQNVDPHLPTRVLDLKDVKSKGTVRVWHTQRARERYIALSHCWGGKQPVKTETSNLKQRTEGFHFADLPSLFQDAVEVALAIGIDYLWIDSLCIIQDDKADWASEAARMADVYMNSYLTIAASVVPNSSGRLLGPRQSKPVAIRIPQKARDGTDENWSLYLDDRLEVPVQEDRRERSFVHDAHESPLNKRAWVLQERLLSPRTLHFTGTQVYWECWRDVEHENLQWDRGSYSKTDTFPGLLSPCNFGAQAEFGDYLVQWLKVVELYTGCKLTFASDKLVAISGIVDRIRAGNDYPFYKGIFAEGLHQQLLWVVDDNSQSEFLPEVGAPSWSWASRDGGVHFIPQSEDFAPCETTHVAWREDLGEEVLDLKADLHKMEGGFSIGKLRKKTHRGYRMTKRAIFNNLLLGDGTVYFRYIHRDSKPEYEDDNAENEGDEAGHQGSSPGHDSISDEEEVENSDHGVHSMDDDDQNEFSDSDHSFVPHFTGYEEEGVFEGDDIIGAVMLDRDMGDQLDIGSLLWVLIGTAQNENWGSDHYCLLAREIEASKFERVGMALVFDYGYSRLYRRDVSIL